MNRNLSKKIAGVLVVFVILLGARTGHAALECRSLSSLFQVFLSMHYASREMTDELKANAEEEFIKAVDPAKSLLLEGEVATLKQNLGTVFETSANGGCQGLETVFTLVVQRVEEDEKLVRDWLSKPDYKLDENLELIVDTDIRGRPKTPAERQELLRKLVQFQLANLMLTDIQLPEAKKDLVHRYELVTKRVKERVEKGELPTIFAHAFATGLDPHTAYLAKEELEDFQIAMRLSLEGIGVMLGTEDGFPTVEEVVSGGAADKLNILKPKDKISSVAQDGAKAVSVIDMDIRSVVKLIRGPRGTKVTLTLLRQGAKTETFSVTIVRDKIEVKDSAASITYETRTQGGKPYKIGIIDLPAFYGGSSGDGEVRSCSADLKKLLSQAKENGAQGIVLNLSRNGGGLLEEAVQIAGLFLRRGAVVATESANGARKVLEDTDPGVTWSGPLLLLTSHMSASASEILAGALKDYHRAIIAGSDHTFGKGTVQVLSPLSADMGAIKVTRGMFFLPGGESTQKNGVKCDIQVPSVFNSDEVGEFKMAHSLASRATTPFLSEGEVNAKEGAEHWAPIDPGLVKRLGELSHSRIAKDPEFAKIEKDLAEARKKDAMKLSEILKKDKKKDDKKLTVKQRLKDMEAPFLKEGVSIMADWLALTQS